VNKYINHLKDSLNNIIRVLRFMKLTDLTFETKLSHYDLRLINNTTKIRNMHKKRLERKKIAIWYKNNQYYIKFIFSTIMKYIQKKDIILYDINKQQLYNEFVEFAYYSSI